MDRDDFFRRIERFVPNRTLDEGTTLASLPVAHRLLITRWLADLLEQPVDHDILRQVGTLGDAWRWLDDALRSGDALRPGGADAAPARVVLRPLVDQDLGPIYLASLDPNTAGAWRYRGRTVSPEEFVAGFSDGVRTQYAVELRATGELMGLVVAYDHNQAGRHCKVAFLRVAAKVPGAAGATLEGVLLFIEHLFATFPYRKLYAEVPAYNQGLFEPGFATEEAVLRDYLFHDGRPVDLHIVSITRDQWERFRASAKG